MAFFASGSFVILASYGDDLRHSDSSDRALQDRFRNIFSAGRVLQQDASHSAPESSSGRRARSEYSTNAAVEALNQASASASQEAEISSSMRGRRIVPVPEAAEPVVKAAPVPLLHKGAAKRVEPKTESLPVADSKPKTKIQWKAHPGKSCQNYARGDSTGRSLEASKELCLTMDECAAIECPSGSVNQCTLRAIANCVPYPPADCYEWQEVDEKGNILSAKVHPEYNNLLREYPFQQVTNQFGNQVNIMLVRSQMDAHQTQLYQKYKDEILFLGISSMNDYPLNERVNYVGMFPGFLHMMREPEKHFPKHVKTILMSQSDFQLPDFPERDYSVPRKYDFTYSASDCDVESDGQGWCGWSKNWSFVKEALKVMCGEFQMTGVLVATKNKANTRAYTIPSSCKGKMIQTTYLANQWDYFTYLKQSRFAFLPQIHDASPRVSTQALAMDVPVLMNWYIQGGWKYVNDQTGEFFHDMSDFRESLRKILRNADIPKRYEPRKWVLQNYGNEHSGKRLFDFVTEHFSHRIRLPKGTKKLFI